MSLKEKERNENHSHSDNLPTICLACKSVCVCVRARMHMWFAWNCTSWVILWGIGFPGYDKRGKKWGQRSCFFVLFFSFFFYRKQSKIHFLPLLSLFISQNLSPYTSLPFFCACVPKVRVAHHIWPLFESTQLFRQLGLKTNRVPRVYASKSPLV